MKNRRPMSSRRRQALRRCALLAAVVMLSSALGLYRFLPVQAMRLMADMEDVEHPRSVKWFYDGTLPITRVALYDLVQGDAAMLLCVTGFSPLGGWYDRAWAKVETWDGTGLYAGVYGHGQDGAFVTYIFGRVDDPAVQTLSVLVTEDALEDVPRSRSVEIPLSDIQTEKNGRRYFATKLDVWPVGSSTTFQVIGSGMDGTAFRTVEAPSQSWSTP